MDPASSLSAQRGPASAWKLGQDRNAIKTKAARAFTRAALSGEAPGIGLGIDLEGEIRAASRCADTVGVETIATKRNDPVHHLLNRREEQALRSAP